MLTRFYMPRTKVEIVQEYPNVKLRKVKSEQNFIFFQTLFRSVCIDGARQMAVERALAVWYIVFDFECVTSRILHQTLNR